MIKNFALGLVFVSVAGASVAAENSADTADQMVQTIIIKNDMVNYPGLTNPSMACLASTIGTMTDSKVAIAPGGCNSYLKPTQT